MAITIEIKRPSGNITVTPWSRGSSTSMVLRRAPTGPQPVVVEETKINRPREGSNEKPRITGSGSLTIPFEDMMLRDADTTHGEGDFVFTREDLLEIADKVWAET